MFQGTDVARIKRAYDPSEAPLAWFRVVYADASNDVLAVHVYGHNEAVGDRPWLAACATLAAAMEYSRRTETSRGGPTTRSVLEPSSQKPNVPPRRSFASD